MNINDINTNEQNNNENFDPRGYYNEYQNTILNGDTLKLNAPKNWAGVVVPFDINSCASTCHNHSQCYGWTFNDKTKECSFNNGINTSVTGKQEDCTSGIYLPSKYIKSIGYLASGNDISNSPSTLNNCELECIKDRNCHGWSYNNSSKQCFLKNKNVNPTIFPSSDGNWASGYDSLL
jgi:hypothetical protein